jgi:hypothetical protein
MTLLQVTRRRRAHRVFGRPGAALLLFAATLAAPAGAAAAASGSAARVEARSGDLLAVGLLHGDRLSIRLSRVLDNSPVHDAVVAVVLRGTTYPTVAEADGSYALTAKDLTLPGEAAVEFRVTEGQDHESLGGILKVASAAVPTDDHGNGRQMWWWALNFGVCIGFLWLFSRRRKNAQG